MNNPILVLQYPDPNECKTIVIAVTRNPIALQAFKEAVIEEAKLTAMDWEADEIIRINNTMELERLEAILDLLVPDEKNDNIFE